MNARSVFCIVALLVFSGTCLAQSRLEGYWQGFWIRDNDSLNVQFEFTKTSGGYTGSFGSDELRVAGIPLGNIRAQFPGAHFEITGDATTTLFDGIICDDSFSGKFQDGQAKGTFAFIRQPIPPPKLHEEEVSFANGAVKLSGTLILPGTAGPYPAIVFVHGSGPEGRWASRFLALQFARSGIASLIFDKRGVGKSTGDWRTAGFEDLAGDASAGVAFLRTHPKIDAHRIGIHGHSQGGALVPLIASLCKPDFVIGSSAPGVPMDETEIYSVGNSIGITSLASADSADAAAYIKELVAVAYHGNGRARLDSLASALHDRSWFFPPPSQDNSYWNISSRIGSYDPVVYWKKVHAPVLLCYGERDQRVPPHASAKRITAVLADAGNTSVTVHFFPGADHTFRIPGRGEKFSWPKNPPGYPGMLIQWVLAQAANKKSSLQK